MADLKMIFTRGRLQNSKAKVAAVVLTIAILILLIFYFENLSNIKKLDVSDHLPRSNSILGNYTKAAVVANNPICADIALEILKKNGTATDAAIAAMLCDGVSLPYAMGVGGGFFMVIYNKATKTSKVINARETAPIMARPNMFGEEAELSETGGLAAAVPGELKGYIEAYNLYGKGVPWEDLVKPTVKLCVDGIKVNAAVAKTLKNLSNEIQKSPGLRKLFINNATGEVLKEGDFYKNFKLAETLTAVMYDPYALYNGTLASDFIRDIRRNGGIMQEEDLKRYKVIVEDALNMEIFEKYSLIGAQPPASGAIVGYILKLLEGLLPVKNGALATQRTTEAFKFGFGIRSQLGDPNFVNITEVMKLISSEEFTTAQRVKINDTNTSLDPAFYGGDFEKIQNKGTASVVVLAENGDAVAATSTLNTEFGSKIVSESTGVILNNEMDDFARPHVVNYFGVSPSHVNRIQPGKRPMSSMCPTIIVDDKGDVRLVVGSAGGTRITTSVALTIIRTLLMNYNVKEAIDEAMFHHQLTPMKWNYQYGTSKYVVDEMKKIGHDVERFDKTTCVTAIQKKDGTIHANCDFRRPGGIAGY